MVHGVAAVLSRSFSFFFAAIVLTAIMIVIARALGGSSPKVAPKSLMTERERAARVIIENLLPGVRVHAQVSMGAILQPARGTSQRDFWRVRNSFGHKIVDYVLEDPATGDILALVELDDRSHNARSDLARDRMTASAGYLTIRIPSGRLSRADIASRLGVIKFLAPSPLRRV